MTRGMGGRSPADITHHLKGIDLPAEKVDLARMRSGRVPIRTSSTRSGRRQGGRLGRPDLGRRRRPHERGLSRGRFRFDRGSASWPVPPSTPPQTSTSRAGFLCASALSKPGGQIGPQSGVNARPRESDPKSTSRGRPRLTPSTARPPRPWRRYRPGTTGRRKPRWHQRLRPGRRAAGRLRWGWPRAWS